MTMTFELRYFCLGGASAVPSVMNLSLFGLSHRVFKSRQTSERLTTQYLVATEIPKLTLFTHAHTHTLGSLRNINAMIHFIAMKELLLE